MLGLDGYNLSFVKRKSVILKTLMRVLFMLTLILSRSRSRGKVG